jgi:hypothetical protein
MKKDKEYGWLEKIYGGALHERSGNAGILDALS